MNNKVNLGFKKNIKKEWMDYSLVLVLSGMTEKEIRTELREYLGKQVNDLGDAYSSDSISMIITILSAWFREKFVYAEYRHSLIQCARKVPKDEWLPLHWAIFTVTYPLWYYVNLQIGKLFNLQSVITSNQVYERVKLTIGDTETVKRNSRYVFRTADEWISLSRDCKHGIYRNPQKINIVNPEILALLLESILIISQDNSEVFDLHRNTSIYPFSFDYLNSNDICMFSKGRIISMIYGLDREILSLDYRFK